jgi:hypothetical protein
MRVPIMREESCFFCKEKKCDSVSAIDTSKTLSIFYPQCYGTVWCGALANQAQLAFCPARAHPFWIKRGVCPLHDLK